MLNVTLRFYGDLNSLTYSSHKRTVTRRLPGPTSTKDLIEGCGVPHTEVDLILVNDNPVEFSYLIEDKDHVSVYPFFSSIDLPDTQRLQKAKLSHNRFVVDVNLGKLARYLRMAGFDTAYRNDAEDKELIEQMLEEERALLTRDRNLLMYNVVEHGYLPRSDDAAEQLEEVFRRFDLFDAVDPYTRCPNCNGVLQPVSKKEVLDRLEPLTKRHFDEFAQCPDCGQVYWAGSHRQRLDPRVKEILGGE